MKPTSTDLWLWEALQTKRVPGWARKLDAKRTLSGFGVGPRDARIAVLLHGAINARPYARRVGDKPRPHTPKLDQRNAMASVYVLRRNPRIHPSIGGDTLAGCLRWRIAQRGTGYDERRPYYARMLRRLER
jgi:hypothetical protein